MPVYLIRAGETGPVKIGKADDPYTRLGDLQVANYEKLKLLRIWEGGVVEEAALHEMFDDLWIRGEWHSFSSRMLGDVGLKVIFPDTSAPPIIESLAPTSVKEIVKKAGGVQAVAKALDIWPSAVCNWRAIPAKYLPKFRVMTGLSDEQIRPDLMPANQAAE
jgi:hypothetical protein